MAERGNVAHLRDSDNVLERAAYWLVYLSWETPEAFDELQGDADRLQRLKALLDKTLYEARGTAGQPLIHAIEAQEQGANTEPQGTGRAGGATAATEGSGDVRAVGAAHVPHADERG